jgi:hypothetical protein
LPGFVVVSRRIRWTGHGICTDYIKKDEIDRTWGMHGQKNIYIQYVGQKSSREETTW